MSQSEGTPVQHKSRHRRPFGGDWLDIWLTLLVVVAVVAALGYFISGLPKDMRPILLLAGTTAGLAGWGLGVLFSPYGGRDRLSSSGNGRLLIGLVVGFLLAWFWQPIKAFFNSCGPQVGSFMSSGMMPVAAVSFIIFLLALITTYVLRSFNRVNN